MTGPDKTCEDMHHKYYFLLKLSRIENLEFHVRLSEGVDHPVNPLAKEGVFSKGNTMNIFDTSLINISTKSCVVKNVYIGAKSSPERFPFTPPFSSNFATCLHCHMRIFQA